jgi:hypothetical protein
MALIYLFLPWICDDNYDDSIHAIDNSTSTIAMGHLEVKGFEMHLATLMNTD